MFSGGAKIHRAGISIKGILAFFIPDFEIWILFCILMKVAQVTWYCTVAEKYAFSGEKIGSLEQKKCFEN